MGRDLPTIRSDPDRLIHLFENLFRTAAERGSARHGTGGRQEAVDGGSTGAGVAVRVGPLHGGFFVEDDGRGIPAADRDQVLEAGYSTNQSGSGFGLAIVSQVADAHGWDLALTGSESGGVRLEFIGVETDSSAAEEATDAVEAAL